MCIVYDEVVVPSTIPLRIVKNVQEDAAKILSNINSRKQQPEFRIIGKSASNVAADLPSSITHNLEPNSSASTVSSPMLSTSNNGAVKIISAL